VSRSQGRDTDEKFSSTEFRSTVPRFSKGREAQAALNHFFRQRSGERCTLASLLDETIAGSFHAVSRAGFDLAAEGCVTQCFKERLNGGKVELRAATDSTNAKITASTTISVTVQ
jgi:hypothetical protein